jgi:hypothetical protein
MPNRRGIVFSLGDSLSKALAQKRSPSTGLKQPELSVKKGRKKKRNEAAGIPVFQLNGGLSGVELFQDGLRASDYHHSGDHHGPESSALVHQRAGRRYQPAAEHHCGGVGYDDS